MTKVRENHGLKTAESPIKTSSSQLAENYCLRTKPVGTASPQCGNGCSSRGRAYPTDAAEFSRAGRTRWRIEHHVFRTLKDHDGMRLEHNYGHGKQHLVV